MRVCTTCGARSAACSAVAVLLYPPHNQSFGAAVSQNTWEGSRGGEQGRAFECTLATLGSGMHVPNAGFW